MMESSLCTQDRPRRDLVETGARENRRHSRPRSKVYSVNPQLCVRKPGRICGKVSRRPLGKRVCREAGSSWSTGVLNLFVTGTASISATARSTRLVAIPEPETFSSCPGQARRAGLCTLSATGKGAREPGAFLTADCRGNLRRIHAQFRKDHDGLHLRHGTEPEMMWLKKGEDGKPDGGFSNPYCYHIDQFESLRPVYMRAIEYSRAMGLDMIQGDHEDAPRSRRRSVFYVRRCAAWEPPTA